MIEIKNVSKHYGEFYALRDINLHINKGEFVSIVGASGSGKSTLLNLIGILDTPSSGEIFLDGKSYKNLTNKEKALLRNKYIGFVFQSFNLDLSFNVFENVEIPLIFAGVKRKERVKKVGEALDAVGMSSKEKILSYKLSGGEKQRVAIARSIVNNPQIILADEPCGNLDVGNGNQIMQLLGNINKLGTTLILVTHNYEHANLASRVVRLTDGKIL